MEVKSRRVRGAREARGETDNPGLIEALISPGIIVAPSTSSVSITGLAARMCYLDRFLGRHLVNSVPMMALVEIDWGLQTRDATHDTVEELATNSD